MATEESTSGVQQSGPKVALALQGGGSHGAFTWGVLDRLLESTSQGTPFSVEAISGASAGGINATLCAAGLANGGAAKAREMLRTFWEAVSRAGEQAGNPLFGFSDPGPFGRWNIDWSPGAIFTEIVGLVASPYNNPFYRDPLGPIIRSALPETDLSTLNAKSGGPQIFIGATNVRTNERTIFTQPEISVDVLRASACLPSEFRTVNIHGVPYWDGGYLGNPPLAPLIAHAQDLILILVNPFVRHDMPPKNARGILDRLNEIGFNASVVLEVNAIEAVNRVLDSIGEEAASKSRFKTVRFHLIRDDDFLAKFGFVSKSSTSWSLLKTLFDRGREVADAWIKNNYANLGQASSLNVKDALLDPTLKQGSGTQAQ
ncbi:patatin-like phospholipase family protein [Paraburkholderia guartelaensis]|uniref:Patatin-like phospholipase family protein n=1 Tax=Paraburkholderia guartelaensis TaxID=2546446 RepID=A0A4R5LCY9_9BURK|nr:patatin-like phospholipase family protein [Paraburkholderia guartelaensis]TDG07078.1 patatin-like phospholipase family protein [Paraburkholderia guartelaensis]